MSLAYFLSNIPSGHKSIHMCLSSFSLDETEASRNVPSKYLLLVHRYVALYLGGKGAWAKEIPGTAALVPFMIRSVSCHTNNT